MRDMKGKTAVVTGAGSGIGRELVVGLACEGANVVLADIDEKGMRETLMAIAQMGVRAECVRCDVSKPGDLDGLAAKAWEKFGAVHLLFNNAGVAVAGPIWTATLEDWKWTLDINLMGVIYGVRSFVPRMLADGHEGHVVNTASVAGLVDIPGSSVYCVSKHGVVSLSECLYHDLRVAKSSIGVSVLCPAYVNTGIGNSQRNRPTDLSATNPGAAPYEEAVRQALLHGKLTAADVAKATIDAVKSNKFYIITHEKIKAAIETRMRDILDGRSPTDVSRPVPGTASHSRADGNPAK